MPAKRKPESKKVYVKQEKTWVEVSDEVYRAYQNPIDAFRHRMQYDPERERRKGEDADKGFEEFGRGRCVCPKSRIWACDADCGMCEYQRAGGTVYLDEQISDGTATRGDFLEDGGADIADIVEDSMLLGALFEKLGLLDPEYSRICEMLLDGYTEREIATALGYKNQSSINYRKTRIAELIRNELSDFIDFF